MSSSAKVPPAPLPSGPRTIVPMEDFVVHALTPIPGSPPPILTNHGGPVIQFVQVVPIYWGAEWSTATNAQLATQIDGFFDFIVTSSLIDLLGEYSISGTPIQHGSRLASVRITNSEPGTVTPTGRQVTDAQIQQALQGWIANHTVPAKTANTLYFIYLPPNCLCIGPGGTGSSCSQFCGYHDVIGGTGIYYAVIPFVNCKGCVFPGQFLDTITEVSTHELCESITDPTLSTWWDPNTGNEIGDICNRQTVRLGNYLVQTEWSDEQQACVFSPIVARARSPLDGYVTTFNNQQHVNYVGTDNHVHELFYDSQWHHNDLTLLTSAPNVAATSELDGYQTSFNNQQHINFIGVDGHVHELFFDSAWHHNDLTALAGAPVPLAGSAIDGYATTFNNQQHVNYIGGNNHVYELYYTNAWHFNDLTQLAGAPPPISGSALDGYQTSFNNQQHVNYIGNDLHVHELYYTNAWHHNDLTALAGAPPAAQGTALDGYETTFNNQQHVNYLSKDNHVHELYYTNAWHQNDLTSLAGAPNAASGSPLDGYQTTFNNQQHVNFLGTDQHVHELYYTSAWHHNDLNVLAGAPNAAPDSALDGYQTAFNDQQHVNYIGNDRHVHELFFTNAWHHNDLTLL